MSRAKHTSGLTKIELMKERDRERETVGWKRLECGRGEREREKKLLLQIFYFGVMLDLQKGHKYISENFYIPFTQNRNILYICDDFLLL